MPGLHLLANHQQLYDVRMPPPIVVSSGRKCPRCGSIDVRSSHPQTLMDAIALALLLKPYRCQDCNDRHYNLRWARRMELPKRDDESL